MKKLFTVFFLLTFFISAYAQDEPPKREFRGAWVASVTNLDWPSSPGLPVSQQKAELIEILDAMEASNFNVVIFQIRPECDALYDSPFEPWSYWLTGGQGSAPNPFYDPLTFAIEETHKRGMELHAWFNPYRADKTVGDYSISQEHVINEHPEWILDFGTMKILDPGIPDVREYNTKVVMDVVRRYNIDGVHMDDYFYPYPPNTISNEDQATFQQYPNGYTNLGDWRRNNVNMQMEMIMDSIDAVKPDVKFGISPFGIWKNGVPPGIVGMDAYNTIYADPIAWLRDEAVDYLTPQLYWKIGGPQDYDKLQKWWADSTVHYNRHLYPGHIYRSGYSNAELPNQLKLDRQNDKVNGSVWFRAIDIVNNTYNFTDSLNNYYYRYPALPPVMEWNNTIMPETPSELTFERLDGTGMGAFVFNAPPEAADGDTATRFVLYRFENQLVTVPDIENPANIVDLSGLEYFTPSMAENQGTYYYAVTALDRNNNESGISNIFELAPPSVPVQEYPGPDAVNVSDTVKFRWAYTQYSSAYSIQVAEDANFENVIAEVDDIRDTTIALAGFEGLSDYFWRIKALNPSGEGDYSAGSKFTTGFPVTPVTLLPPGNTANMPTNILFAWETAEAATGYRLQVAISRDFKEGSVVVDTVTAGLEILVEDLEAGRFLFWRVAAVNQYGSSMFTAENALKTLSDPLAAPVLTNPVNNADTLDGSLLFAWEDVSYSDEYLFMLAKDSGSETEIVADTAVTGAEVIITGLEPFTSYTWKVRGIYNYGYSDWSEEFGFSTGATGLESEAGLPVEYSLSANYPNPFNPATKINFSLPERSAVELNIYNVLGEKVASLVNRELEAGYYTYDFNAGELPSGIYIYRLSAGERVFTKKMTLLK